MDAAAVADAVVVDAEGTTKAPRGVRECAGGSDSVIRPRGLRRAARGVVGTRPTRVASAVAARASAAAWLARTGPSAETPGTSASARCRNSLRPWPCCSRRSSPLRPAVHLGPSGPQSRTVRGRESARRGCWSAAAADRGARTETALRQEPRGKPGCPARPPLPPERRPPSSRCRKGRRVDRSGRRHAPGCRGRSSGKLSPRSSRVRNRKSQGRGSSVGQSSLPALLPRLSDGSQKLACCRAVAAANCSARRFRCPPPIVPRNPARQRLGEKSLQLLITHSIISP